MTATATTSTTETRKVTRGAILVEYVKPCERTVWWAKDNGGNLVAEGVEGNLAYALTEGNIALVRAGAAPF